MTVCVNLKRQLWANRDFCCSMCVCARKHCLPITNMYCDNWLIRNARSLTCQHHIHNMPWTYIKLSTSVLCATYNLCIRLFLFLYVQYGIHNVTIVYITFSCFWQYRISETQYLHIRLQIFLKTMFISMFVFHAIHVRSLLVEHKWWRIGWTRLNHFSICCALPLNTTLAFVTVAYRC